MKTDSLNTSLIYKYEKYTHWFKACIITENEYTLFSPINDKYGHILGTSLAVWSCGRFWASLYPLGGATTYVAKALSVEGYKESVTNMTVSETVALQTYIRSSRGGVHCKSQMRFPGTISCTLRDNATDTNSVFSSKYKMQGTFSFFVCGSVSTACKIYPHIKYRGRSDNVIV